MIKTQSIQLNLIPVLHLLSCGRFNSYVIYFFITMYLFRIRSSEAEEKRHERKYDGLRFHGKKEKVAHNLLSFIYISIFI